MSYVQKELSKGERIVYQTTLHPIVFLVPSLLVAWLSLSGFLALADEASSFFPSLSGFAMAGFVAVWAWLRFISSEFAVTDRRVLIKTGFVSRKTLETMLTEVEGVQVAQGILGRMLDYGTLTVTGTGGTNKPFKKIRRPLEFRKHVQDGSTASHAKAAQDHLQALHVGGNEISAREGAEGDDTVSKLERLGRLRESGVLSQEEFEDQKRRLLDT